MITGNSPLRYILVRSTRRHTTFMTELTGYLYRTSRFTGPIEEALEEGMGRSKLSSIQLRKKSFPHGHGYTSRKELRHAGGLTNLDESDEINACTIIVPVDVDGKTGRMVVIIQNETHNHPTEIGTIRRCRYLLRRLYPRPLSGRAYVYRLCALQALATTH